MVDKKNWLMGRVGAAELAIVEVVVESFLCEERIVSSAFYDLSAVDD